MNQLDDNKFSSRHPLISVVLPVYNGAAYLEEAIQSILWQSYDNFEFIILNDGSTDESASIIQKLKDPRIRYYEQANQGLAATLNRAVGLAKGKYIARQDQDDVSLPLRLEKQVAFLENHFDHGMVGTWAAIWEENTDSKGTHKHPSESLLLKFELLFDNPFVHSSVMIRKAVFEKVGLYCTDKSRQPPEDYELWSRIARKYEVANIPEILHIYREISSSMSRIGTNPFLDRVINISAENLAWAAGKPEPNLNITALSALSHCAWHRIAPKPNFREISYILMQAADNLSSFSKADSGILRDKARSRLKSIRFNYLKFRHGCFIGRLLAKIERVLQRG
ncbi:MAG: glycosyltransferase family 2 protein [Thermincolia bacterium]